MERVVRRLRVHLVADHMVTDVLAERLDRETDLVVVGRTGPADEGLDVALARAGPDVVVLDAASGRDWVAAARRVTAAAPEARLVVVATGGDAEGAIEACRLGAAAWFPRGCSADDIVDVVRAVHRGHAFYPSDQLDAVLRRLRGDAEAVGNLGGEIGRLTERERTVLALLTTGRRSREIAERLDISENTVRAHTARIFRKLSVHSRLEAVRVARRAGFRTEL